MSKCNVISSLRRKPRKRCIHWSAHHHPTLHLKNMVSQKNNKTRENRIVIAYESISPTTEMIIIIIITSITIIPSCAHTNFDPLTTIYGSGNRINNCLHSFLGVRPIEVAAANINGLGPTRSSGNLNIFHVFLRYVPVLQASPDNLAILQRVYHSINRQIHSAK